jgi:antitoxin component YwqK of YwqJK toxin-antitoxin module
MKYLKLILFIVFLTFASIKVFEYAVASYVSSSNTSVPEQPTIKSTEVEVLNGLVYHQINLNEPFSGILEEYDRQGNRTSASHYKDGRLHGDSIYWYKNGEKASQTHYKNGVVNGASVLWYENGEMLYMKMYEKGMPIGVQSFWHENGQLFLKRKIVNGNDVIITDGMYSENGYEVVSESEVRRLLNKFSVELAE